MVQLVKNLPVMQETWVWSLDWEEPLQKGKALHSSILAWRIPWTVQQSPWTGHKVSDTTHFHCHCIWASQVALVGKNPPNNAGEVRQEALIPGSGRSPAGTHRNSLQCSCLENPLDRGAWRATVHRVAKSWARLKWFSTYTMMENVPCALGKNA